MRILLLANMTYALVLPVIEIFVSAFVMRNSHAVGTVVTYQLSVYIATPIAFLLNGLFLSKVGPKHAYAAGMLLSGLTVILLMRTGNVTPIRITVSGLAMGLTTGLFWANRGFLALAATDDNNRNYYYGIETFSGTLAAVVVPALIGWLISGTTTYGWLGGAPNRAYRWIAATVFVLTAMSAFLVERGSFRNPSNTRFVYFRFHPLWCRMLQLAALKGLPQGYIITAPAMLIMVLVGKEGTLGFTQAFGGILSAIILYTVGRITAPQHRSIVFAAALLLFFIGSVVNALLFNAAGVLVFIGSLVLAKPMLDLAYNPIEMQVIDTVARIERRSEYAYFFNHEFALFFGRALGCTLFLAINYWGSAVAALKFAMPIIALIQLYSIRVAANIFHSLRINENIPVSRVTPTA
jgi:YQGE family putative transporter